MAEEEARVREYRMRMGALKRWLSVWRERWKAGVISYAEYRSHIARYAAAVRWYAYYAGEADFKAFIRENGCTLLARHTEIPFKREDMDWAVELLLDLWKTATKGTPNAWHGIRGVVYMTYLSARLEGVRGAWKLNLREGWVEDWERLPVTDRLDLWTSTRTQKLLSSLNYSGLADVYDRFVAEKASYEAMRVGYGLPARARA